MRIHLQHGHSSQYCTDGDDHHPHVLLSRIQTIELCGDESVIAFHWCQSSNFCKWTAHGNLAKREHQDGVQKSPVKSSTV